MRIALVHTRLLHRGGLETRLFSYIRYLRDQGHEVTVIVYRIGRGVKIPEGIHVHKVRIPFVRRIRKQVVFDRKLGRILAREDFDLVFSLGRTSHHDVVLLPGNHLGYLRALGKNPLKKHDHIQIELDRATYQAPGTILACSEMMKEEVVELYGADPEKIHILYPPTDLNRFHLEVKERKAACRKAFGMSPGKMTFVLVSASHSRKGLPLLMEAFASLQDAPVELLVAGGEEVPTQLPNVRGLGFVRNTEDLFAGADCMLLPAVYEPFGQVVSESILCGTPVMVSHMVGARSVVEPQVGKVISSFNPAVWAAAIRNFKPDDYSFDSAFGYRHRLDLARHMEVVLSAGKADQLGAR